jgi:hypothetical protein
MKFLEWLIGRVLRSQKLWSLLPDKCQIPGCCRKGVRGNENVINGKIVCDYCHVRLR